MALSPAERDWLETRARRRAAMRKHRAARRSNLGNCPTCGLKEIRLTRDHIQPKSRGGSNDLSNIQWICRECNAEKADSLDWIPPVERSKK
jgi:5-methylcytosine-specific restriction protein A